MAVSFHQPPRRILVRGVNWLGDAVMTTPALVRLREKFPQAHITLLGPEKLRELWQLHPAVNDVIGFAEDSSLLEVSRKLRAGKFDLALVMPNSPRSALEVWLAGIPQRVGYARPWRNWLLTQAVATRPGHVRMRKRTPEEVRKLIQNVGAKSEIRNPKSETAHQLHEYLHLVASLGASSVILPPQLHVSDEDVQSVAARFQLDLMTRWLGINPGAEYVFNSWRAKPRPGPVGACSCSAARRTRRRWDALSRNSGKWPHGGPPGPSSLISPGALRCAN
jgi:ADP-heptose:LPS heptosyltransferase